MSALIALLERESRKRGLLAAGAPLTPETAFAVIRDMPYRRASSRRPAAIIEEWRGTCSGKHYLLAEVLAGLGLNSQVMMVTHRFTPENTRHFPSELRLMTAAAPIPDVHTYLLADSPGGRWVVDATWPRRAENLGMPVNHHWTPGRDMLLACQPIDAYPVPAGRDPQEFKEALIREFCGGQSEQRDWFIEKMGQWLSAATAEPAAGQPADAAAGQPADAAAGQPNGNEPAAGQPAIKEQA